MNAGKQIADYARLLELDNALGREMLAKKIDNAIAAAVQAEREANCAAMCHDCAAGLKAKIGDEFTWYGRFVHYRPDEQRYVGCGANAIRGRNAAHEEAK